MRAFLEVHFGPGHPHGVLAFSGRFLGFHYKGWIPLFFKFPVVFLDCPGPSPFPELRQVTPQIFRRGRNGGPSPGDAFAAGAVTLPVVRDRCLGAWPALGVPVPRGED